MGEISIKRVLHSEERLVLQKNAQIKGRGSGTSFYPSSRPGDGLKQLHAV